MDNVLRVLVAALLVTASVCVRLETPPADVTSQVGQTATIVCDVLLVGEEVEIVEWTKISTSGEEDYTIYVSRDQQLQPNVLTSDPDKYEIEGQYSLVILDVEYRDAGVYECRLVLSRMSGRANLVVLGVPVMSVDEDFQVGHVTNITCLAEFSAPPSGFTSPDHLPRMRTYLEESTETQLAQEYTTLQTAYDETIYVIQQSFQYEATIADDSKMLVCKVYTEQSDAMASAEMQIMLHYAANSVEIFPVKSEYEVGDVISCRAAGHPEPHYQWLSASESSHVIHSADLIVTSEMDGDNTWTCEASNVVRGTAYLDERIITFTVDAPTVAPVKEVYSEPSAEKSANDNTVTEVKSGSSAMIAVYVLVPLAAIVILIVIVIVCKRSKRKNGHIYSPRKKDEEAANAHEKEQLKNEDTKTATKKESNGTNTHSNGNGTKV